MDAIWILLGIENWSKHPFKTVVAHGKNNCLMQKFLICAQIFENDSNKLNRKFKSLELIRFTFLTNTDIFFVVLLRVVTHVIQLQ